MQNVGWFFARLSLLVSPLGDTSSADLLRMTPPLLQVKPIRGTQVWKLGRFGLLGLCLLGLWLLRFRARSFLTSTVRMLLR